MTEAIKLNFSRKFFILILFIILVLFSSTSVFSQSDDGGEIITITTYYPSPYGVYRELTTTSNTYLATEEGNVDIGKTPQPLPVAPNNHEGNLYVNDVYIRSIKI